MRHAPCATRAQLGGNTSGLRNVCEWKIVNIHRYTHIYTHICIHICICMKNFIPACRRFDTPATTPTQNGAALCTCQRKAVIAACHTVYVCVLLYAVIKEIPQATKSVAPAMPPIDLPRIVCNCTCNKQTFRAGRNETYWGDEGDGGGGGIKLIVNLKAHCKRKVSISLLFYKIMSALCVCVCVLIWVWVSVCSIEHINMLAGLLLAALTCWQRGALRWSEVRYALVCWQWLNCGNRPLRCNAQNYGVFKGGEII